MWSTFIKCCALIKVKVLAVINFNLKVSSLQTSPETRAETRGSAQAPGILPLDTNEDKPGAAGVSVVR